MILSILCGGLGGFIYSVWGLGSFIYSVCGVWVVFSILCGVWVVLPVLFWGLGSFYLLCVCGSG